jgi:hypothetical protein
MKREKKLTKKERQAITGKGPAGVKATAGGGGGQHIHCVACGRHIDAEEFDNPATATYVKCAHGSTFASCVGCQTPAQKLLDEHDRTGQPVKAAGAWH